MVSNGWATAAPTHPACNQRYHQFNVLLLIYAGALGQFPPPTLGYVPPTVPATQSPT